MAVITPFELAEKIAQAIDAQAWSPSFRARADFVPEYLLTPDIRKPDALAIDELRVDVMPRKRAAEGISRGYTQRTYTFDISFIKKLAGENDEGRRVDLIRLLELVQKVESYFATTNRLPNHEAASIDEVATDPLYDTARLRNDAEFASRIVLSLQTEGQE